MLIKLTNGAPEAYTIAQLRRDNPQTSFPKEVTKEILSLYNVYSLKQTRVPEIDSKTHRIIKDVRLLNGEWTQVWQISEIDQKQAESNVRAYRDNLLAMTDWVVIRAYGNGVPAPDDLLQYRQALRDITTQEGFPYSITWLTKPL
jgi:hypothetical protein